MELSADKRADLDATCSAMLIRIKVPFREVRTLAGRSSWIAGLLPQLRPFVEILGYYVTPRDL